MKLFIQSCHAALEHDHVDLFTGMGHEIYGDWDIGSKERPKISGVTDKNSNINDFDKIILHQVPNYPNVMQDLLQKGKKVIIVSFGQADTWQYEALAKICKEFPHAYIAAYSNKDFNKHVEFGTPFEKLRLIRFNKNFDDYYPWRGSEPKAYAACNNIHKRGPGCAWALFKPLMDSTPIILSGVGTEEVGGLGQVPVGIMQRFFATSACSVSFGTAPAAMTLAQIEAVCAGTPLVLLDNGHGCAGEGLTKMIHSSVQDVKVDIEKLISDKSYRELRHQESLEARKMFDVVEIRKQWEELIGKAFA